MNKMMRKIWRNGNEAVLRTQLQLQEALRALPSARARLGKGQEGATMVEYAILVALISIAAIVIIVALGNKIDDVFTNVNAHMGAAIP